MAEFIIDRLTNQFQAVCEVYRNWEMPEKLSKVVNLKELRKAFSFEVLDFRENF
ncbi:hypothetical protein I8752_13660 [Nostocaceae cyanobacterium CENA369]|uniref:Uncharacterized protein n=1 Tax=Dendronalium phyllosphericum CENA369 TaxID=1725256 RepID=A0A8J7LFF2_9NOST|nr:hypothetical protein [Dendronalium phyllosphericum]MBH8574048.1 hypothetical protein [Dendronalium phyllosphericum CENA369]